MIISLLLSNTAFANFRCFQGGKIRSIKDRKSSTRKVSFCIGHPLFKMVSFNCINSNKCQAVQGYQLSVNMPKTYSDIGSRDYHKCYLIGGRAELIEYHNGSKWIETGICHFPDSSFISVFNIISTL
ncbi:MAG: hypothetical protein HN353_02425 [Bdellovibrionales bacterium]|nr:hypothetical protein [Bdellovibrionales bacterium]MBT3525542.1 hypothetical protein [Bdellovibrionales bacterium]MBT7667928.1 hypothetical protein [Bdellovibrionales bacterium]